MSEIKVEKITDAELMQWACSMTIDKESNMSLERVYRNEHSPMRTQIFKITLIGIPTFVSTHFVRHQIGVQHFCKSQREDRGGSKESNRWTPTNHGMLCNAQSLVNMARKRLCYKASMETFDCMEEIVYEVGKVDPALAERLVPDCIYRGACYEDKPCGIR